MLDGDKVNDCGGSMLSAKEVLSFILKEVIPMVRKDMEREMKRMFKDDEGIFGPRWTQKLGYNQALQDVLDLLNKQTKEKM